MTDGSAITRIGFDDREAIETLAKRGFGEWGPAFHISAEVVDGFTRTTGTVDTDGAIPGFLILSLLPRIMPTAEWRIEGHKSTLNMGCSTLRFPATAPIDAYLQGRSRIVSTKSHPRGCIVAFEYEAREEGSRISCMLATIELLYIGAPA